MGKDTKTAKPRGLEGRVALIEQRLGLDPAAIQADADESAARGAEAHVLSEPAAEDES